MSKGNTNIGIIIILLVVSVGIWYFALSKKSTPLPLPPTPQIQQEASPKEPAQVEPQPPPQPELQPQLDVIESPDELTFTPRTFEASIDSVEDFQAFLKRNNRLSNNYAIGEYDEETVRTLKKIQEEYGLYESAVVDDATMFVKKLIEVPNLYENYGDEHLTFSLDTKLPYFRIFSIGTHGIALLNDFSAENHIVQLNLHGGVRLDNRNGVLGDVFSLSGASILNNTGNSIICFWNDESNDMVGRIDIDVNGIYRFSQEINDIAVDNYYYLQCDDKIMKVEFVYQSQGFG